RRRMAPHTRERVRRISNTEHAEISTPALPFRRIPLVVNPAIRQRLLQLVEAFVGDERVIEVDLPEGADSRQMRDTGVGEVDAVEREIGQLRQAAYLRKAGVADLRVIELERFEARELSDDVHAAVADGR